MQKVLIARSMLVAPEVLMFVDPTQGIDIGAKEEVKLSKLRIKINEKLKGYRGNWSVYVKDLKTGDVLSINETSMYPASVIKLFVMEAVYAGAAEKKISLNSYVNGLLDSMITISDNESYNELVRTVGQGSFA